MIPHQISCWDHRFLPRKSAPDNREYRSGFTPGHPKDGEDEERRGRKEKGDEEGEEEEEEEEEEGEEEEEEEEEEASE